MAALATTPLRICSALHWLGYDHHWILQLLCGRRLCPLPVVVSARFLCYQRRLPLDIADAWYRSAWQPVWYSTIMAARLHLRDLKQKLRGIAILLLGFGYW